MTYKQQERIIAALLNEDLNLRQGWSQPAEVTHIPFMGTREHFFLLINILVTPEFIESNKLLNNCLGIVRQVVESGMLIDEKTVEVAAFTTLHAKTTRRLIRLSVASHAFPQMKCLKAVDVTGNLHEGIACHWPVQNTSAP